MRHEHDALSDAHLQLPMYRERIVECVRGCTRYVPGFVFRKFQRPPASHYLFLSSDSTSFRNFFTREEVGVVAKAENAFSLAELAHRTFPP
jgi:hypothetical protein